MNKITLALLITATMLMSLLALLSYNYITVGYGLNPTIAAPIAIVAWTVSILYASWSDE